MLTQRSSNQGKFVYILVTPVKNEEDNLPNLIQSIVSQSVQPTAWFMVDDGSEDRSSQIVSQAVSAHPWIHLVRLDTNRVYDIGEHYASVCIVGFGHALTYCEQNNLKFEHIALSDADMIYPEDYFAKCIHFLRDNKQFGIVSGRILIRDKGGHVYEEDRIQLGHGEPCGTGRVWRKETFADTGGYIVAKSPDTVSNVKALLRGWKIKQLANVICYQSRDTGGKTGLWSGYFDRGGRAYYLNMNPLSIFNAIVDMMFISRPKKPIIKSLALLSGYCKSFFRREQRLEDDEVKNYLGSYRRVVKHYWLFLKGLNKRRGLH